MIPDKVIEKFHEGRVVNSPDACWPFEGGGYNKKGWHRQISYKHKNYGAHRVAYELANGGIPDGLFVLHRCDNPVCCNPRHLFVGTQSDNASDMWNKKRGNPGNPAGLKLGPSPNRKITPDKERAVVEMYCVHGYTQKQIASYLKCSDVTISNFLKTSPEAAEFVGRNGKAAALRRGKIKREAARLRSKGRTQYEVADELGVSQAFISKLENEHGETNASNT